MICIVAAQGTSLKNLLSRTQYEGTRFEKVNFWHPVGINCLEACEAFVTHLRVWLLDIGLASSTLSRHTRCVDSQSRQKDLFVCSSSTQSHLLFTNVQIYIDRYTMLGANLVTGKGSILLSRECRIVLFPSSKTSFRGNF